MAAVDVGRICLKISGRESGHHCVILEVIDKNFALITGPKKITGVKRRRVNINHLMATKHKIKIMMFSRLEIIKSILDLVDITNITVIVDPDGKTDDSTPEDNYDTLEDVKFKDIFPFIGRFDRIVELLKALAAILD